MKKSTIFALMAASIFTILSALLILGLKLVDVAAIGPNGSEIGFAALNGTVRDLIGTNAFFETLSEIIGYTAYVLVAIMALFGLVQLIRRRSLLKVDTGILALGVTFVVVLGLYVLFNKVVINFRPILEADGTLEASFPSSHSMQAVVVFGSSAVILAQMTGKSWQGALAAVVCTLFAVTGVACRLLSGVHWLTDIVGGVLIGLSLMFWLLSAKGLIEEKKAEK